MRQIVRASLPLGSGIVLDPFMGAGSTIAAAVAVGYTSVGIEVDPLFFALAEKAIPALSSIPVSGTPRMIRSNGVVHLNGNGKTDRGPVQGRL
jgi:DNA modification methylase